MQTRQRYSSVLPRITWEKLPEDFILPDDPVESNLQPLLAAALRESLELAGLILESMIIASNFGLCANVNDKTVVKAPDWIYIPSAYPIKSGEIRRSYTPTQKVIMPKLCWNLSPPPRGQNIRSRPIIPTASGIFMNRF